jgi:hypothetical protein
VASVLFGAYASGLIGGTTINWYFVIGETWVLAAVLYVVGVWVSLRTKGDIRKILGFSKPVFEMDAEPGEVHDMATEAGV